MKTLLLALFLPLSSFAASYDCALEANAGRTPLFVIDFEQTDSASKKIPEIGEVGCIALRFHPEVFSCTIAFGEGKSISAVAELGSALLRLQTDAPGEKIAMQCSRM